MDMRFDENRVPPRTLPSCRISAVADTDGLFRCCVLHRGRSTPVTIAYSTYPDRIPRFVGITEAFGKAGHELEDHEYASLRRSIRDAWSSIAATIEVEMSVTP